MTNLVENLLSLVRADGGAVAATLTPVAVGDLFRQAAQTWKRVAERAMLDFRVEMPENEVSILVNPVDIDRVLSILLENAIRYTPPGGTVVLSATSAGASVVLAVRDTGIGISAEDQLRIFDRFYRAAQTSKSIPRGSGLGLALAKWIVERHGTPLKVESEPGKGSCFSFAVKRTGALIATGRTLSNLQAH